MAPKKVTGIPGLFGGTNYYDENGKQIGYSMPGIIPGTVEHFNADGSSAEFSAEGIFGGVDHFDESGRQAGFSTEGIFGGMNHYSADGSFAGFSAPNLITGSTFFGSGDQDHPGMFDDYSRKDSPGYGSDSGSDLDSDFGTGFDSEDDMGF